MSSSPDGPGSTKLFVARQSGGWERCLAHRGGMTMIRFKFVGFGVTVFNAWSLFAPTAAWSAKSISAAVVNRVVIDPGDSNTLYAATEIGVFKSTDAAQTWF